MYKTKQVIVVRKDLKMRRGKEAAQVAHASLAALTDRLTFKGPLLFHADIPPVMVEWLNDSFAKIVVSCDSEEALFDLQKQAEAAGIINALIQDNGTTEFKEECSECDGEGILCLFDHKELDTDTVCPICRGSGKVSKPTYTTLAIGPDYSEKIDKITGRLQLR